MRAAWHSNIWRGGEAKRRMSVMGHIRISGGGIKRWIRFIADAPVLVIGDRFIRRGEINSKIISPQFTGTVKVRPEINNAGFLGKLRDDFVLLPVCRAANGPVAHIIVL